MMNAVWFLVGVFVIWLGIGNRFRKDRYGAFLTLKKISGADDADYLYRNFLLPRNRIFNVYLHQFKGSDDSRTLHDHPWFSISIVLKGQLIEHLPDNQSKIIRRGQISIRSPQFQHRIELPEQHTAVTLFCTGPVVRTWGFICPDGWVSWKDFEKNDGCD